MNIIIFEDSNVKNLEPFSINHASFEIKCGMYSNLDRITNCFDNKDNFYLIVRHELKDLIQERFPKYKINPDNIPEGLCLNGSAIWNSKLLNKIQKDVSFSSNGKLISYKNSKKINFKDFENTIDQIKNISDDIDINYISYQWDCIDLFKSVMELDKLKFKDNKSVINNDRIWENNSKNIFKHKSTIIEPGCFLDASTGPIILSKNTLIKAGSVLRGPIFIDEKSIINEGSKIKGNVLIGPKCKIGGEVSSSIFHGHSNKAHDGFIGDSYIGEWVNLGANTNNSNLKNNYGQIKFRLPTDYINTKRIFLGAMIGDFTRTGISTMINTGSFIGLGCNIFGSEFQSKHIKSFAWGKDSKVDFDKFINTIKIMKKRRSLKLSNIEINFLKSIH